jgi:predicted acetyltransferase
LEPTPSRLTLECRLAGIAEQVVLARMLELYQYELSDIWDQDVDDAGEYGYALSRYWERAKHFPYVALVDGKYAGFALVDGEVKLPGGEFSMDQFFVLKKYRRRSIGRALARHVLLAHPGLGKLARCLRMWQRKSFGGASLPKSPRGILKNIGSLRGGGRAMSRLSPDSQGVRFNLSVDTDAYRLAVVVLVFVGHFHVESHARQRLA